MSAWAGADQDDDSDDDDSDDDDSDDDDSDDDDAGGATEWSPGTAPLLQRSSGLTGSLSVP